GIEIPPILPHEPAFDLFGDLGSTSFTECSGFYSAIDLGDKLRIGQCKRRLILRANKNFEEFWVNAHIVSSRSQKNLDFVRGSYHMNGLNSEAAKRAWREMRCAIQGRLQVAGNSWDVE